MGDVARLLIESCGGAHLPIVSLSRFGIPTNHFRRGRPLFICQRCNTPCSSSAWIRHFGVSAKLVFDRALALKPLSVGINLPTGIWTRVPLPINFIGLHVQFTAQGIVLHSDSHSTLGSSRCMCICHGERTRLPTATTVILAAAAMSPLLIIMSPLYAP